MSKKSEKSRNIEIFLGKCEERLRLEGDLAISINIRSQKLASKRYHNLVSNLIIVCSLVNFLVIILNKLIFLAG